MQTFQIHYLGNNLLFLNHHDTFLSNPVEKDPVEGYQLHYCLVVINYNGASDPNIITPILI